MSIHTAGKCPGLPAAAAAAAAAVGGSSACLVDVAPVGACLLEALVENVHDKLELVAVEAQREREQEKENAMNSMV